MPKTKRKKSYAIEFTMPSKTSQSAAKATDVKQIVKNYNATGLLRRVNDGQLEYRDLTQVVSADGRFELTEAYQLIKQAEENFRELPAHLRAKFDNDPAIFHEFVNDPANYDAMCELGLAHRDPAPSIEGVDRDRASGRLVAKRKAKPNGKAQEQLPAADESAGKPQGGSADEQASSQEQPNE
jgi:phage internal scaffolding protein